MLTVLSVIGTRPEAIKMAPVIEELQRRAGSIRSVVCVSAQHREMLDQTLRLFNITSDFDLDVMVADQSLSQLTSRLFTAFDAVLTDVKPDWVLAEGDTTTVFVAAVGSFYRHVRFGHVEAGLRTGNLLQPFPEELNRRVADMVANAFFAPTDRARRALLAEGIPAEKIHLTGNTIVDALLHVASRPFDWNSGPLSSINGKRLVLITAHRRESFGRPFQELCRAIAELASRFSGDGVEFVYPVHLNPNVQRPVQEILGRFENVKLIQPLDYLALVHLMKRAELILTDSGGIQEEAPTFGVPILVMRERTERPEGVEAGMVRLVGTSHENIVREASHLLTDPNARADWPRGVNPYGDGRAAERIVSVLLNSEPTNSPN